MLLLKFSWKLHVQLIQHNGFSEDFDRLLENLPDLNNIDDVIGNLFKAELDSMETAFKAALVQQYPNHKDVADLNNNSSVISLDTPDSLISVPPTGSASARRGFLEEV